MNNQYDKNSFQWILGDSMIYKTVTELVKLIQKKVNEYRELIKQTSNHFKKTALD